MGRWTALACALLLGCGRIGFEQLDGSTPADAAMDAAPVDAGSIDAGSPVDAGPPVDAGADAGPSADAGSPVLGPFQPPHAIAELMGVTADDPSLTGDRLGLYFNRDGDIQRSTRASASDPWGAPVAVAELNTTSTETSPEVSAGALVLHFGSTRAGGSGSVDIWRSTRAARTAAWGAPVRVAELCTAQLDTNPAPSADGLEIVLSRGASATARDLFLATRAAGTDPWSAPVRIDEASSAGNDGGPILIRGGLVLVFFSDRDGNSDLFYASRPSRGAPFGPPVRIDEVNTAADEEDPWVSEDGAWLVFSRDGTLFETSL